MDLEPRAVRSTSIKLVQFIPCNPIRANPMRSTCGSCAEHMPAFPMPRCMGPGPIEDVDLLDTRISISKMDLLIESGIVLDACPPPSKKLTVRAEPS